MLEFSLFPKFYFPAVPNMFFFSLEPHVAGAIYSYFSRLPHRRSSTKIAQALGDKNFFLKMSDMNFNLSYIHFRHFDSPVQP